MIHTVATVIAKKKLGLKYKKARSLVFKMLEKHGAEGVTLIDLGWSVTANQVVPDEVFSQFMERLTQDPLFHYDEGTEKISLQKFHF